MRSLFASIYAYYSNRSRYGAVYCDARKEISHFQWLPTLEQKQVAEDMAARYAGLAERTTVYFRPSEGVEPVTANGNNWRSYPILKKSVVRADPQAFINENIRSLGRIHRLGTSGTTGAPLSVLITNEAIQREYAYAWDFRSWYGCRRGDRMATIAGHPVVPVAREKPPFWVINRADNQILFSSYHMSKANLRHYVKALSDYAPVFMTGFPSSMAVIGAAALEAGVKIRPRAIFFASETLHPHHRSVIREAFGVEPRLWYGNTELAGHIVECPEGRLHVREDHSLIEFINDSGNEARPGELARMVCTSYHNRAMFFIRYETGDTAVLGEEQTCPCGRGGRLVKSVVGRLDDYIIDGAGRMITRLGYLFKNAEGLEEAQILQNEPGAITIRLVAEPRRRAAIEAAILEESRHRLVANTRISFEYVAALDRTASGKTQLVVRNIDARPPDTLRGKL